MRKEHALRYRIENYAITAFLILVAFTLARCSNATIAGPSELPSAQGQPFTTAIAPIPMDPSEMPPAGGDTCGCLQDD